MTPIYIKLGTGVTSFVNERLSLMLFTPILTAAVFDYSNINDEVSTALNAGTIVQIDEEEYYNIPKSNITTTVTPGYLISLYKYIDGCPLPGDDLFLQRGTDFLKLNWKKLTECLGISSKFKFIGVIGDTAVVELGAHGYELPAAGGTVFKSQDLKGKTAVRVEVTGIPIYPLVQAGKDYFIFDPSEGSITRPGGFGLDEVFAVYEI